ncbi:hypothetical protein M408DRAFT_281534 [Serendipita vermifera MAFF 305830]|uniref:Uncharacterized protein n=1 Tax=Serendipita vermifera MAFF 305830 TaxID=933852 RepID=A0A0C2W8C7_SERVB|nr:hypothetical protein M408DRAFT_281534 [Serendipita vermifera MAFF 305830]
MMKTGSISLFDSLYPSASTNGAQRRYRPSYARNEYSNPLLFQRPCLRSLHNSQGRFPLLFSHHAAHFLIPRSACRNIWVAGKRRLDTGGFAANWERPRRGDRRGTKRYGLKGDVGRFVHRLRDPMAFRARWGI